MRAVGLDHARSRWRRNPGSWRAFALIAALVAYEAAALLVGRPQRTQGPAYSTINDLGGARSFGAVLAVLVAALIVSTVWLPVLLRPTLMTVAAVHFVLAAGFAAAVGVSPFAGLLAPAFALVIGLWAISQQELYR